MQEQYLAVIKQIIEDNIGNESFSVADLAREVGLSRSMLHRKLIGLTGKSATDIITEIRLKKAFEFLENDAGTVAEIAYMVGYSSPSYFNKVFRKTYKVSPGEVRRKGRGKIPHLRIVNENGVPASAGSKRSRIKTFIASRRYGDTPKGIRKPATLEESFIDEKRKGSTPWRIASYISFVVILTMVGILLYPKIIKSDRLSGLRNEEGKISLAVLPFENLSGDPSLYYWQNGISEYLINKLGASQELVVTSSQVIVDVLSVTRPVNNASLSNDIARLTASKIGASTYITGNYIGKENDATIMLNLVSTDNGELIWSTNVSGDLASDFSTVLDHLSDTVRNYMEIRALEGRAEPEMIHAFPNSTVAYRHYLEGLSAIVRADYVAASESLKRAYDLDTTFTLAAFYLAFAYKMNDAYDPVFVPWVRRAHELKNNLPAAYRTWLELWYAHYITKNYAHIRDGADRMYMMDFKNRFLWLDLALIYSDWLEDYPKAISTYKKVEDLNRQWGGDWKYDRYYSYYARDLLGADRPEEAIRIADIGLQLNPANGRPNRVKGAAYIMLGDSVNAQIYKNVIWNYLEDYPLTKAWAIQQIAYMHLLAKDTIGAATYYRQSFEMDRGMSVSLYMCIFCQLRTDMYNEECAELIEFGLKMFPDVKSFRWTKGLYLHKLGRHQEALEILREVREMWISYNYELERDIRKVEHALELESGSSLPG